MNSEKIYVMFAIDYKIYGKDAYEIYCLLEMEKEEFEKLLNRNNFIFVKFKKDIEIEGYIFRRDGKNHKTSINLRNKIIAILLYVYAEFEQIKNYYDYCDLNEVIEYKDYVEKLIDYISNRKIIEIDNLDDMIDFLIIISKSINFVYRNVRYYIDIDIINIEKMKKMNDIEKEHMNMDFIIEFINKFDNIDRLKRILQELEKVILLKVFS